MSTENTTGKKFVITDAGPIQAKRVRRALAGLEWERGSFVEVRGTEGLPETQRRTRMTTMYGKQNAEAVDKELAEVGERFGWEATKANAKELADELLRARVRAADAAPVVYELQTQKAVAERAEQETKRAAVAGAVAEAISRIVEQRPPAATALIVAELDESTSDLMTDYHGHTTGRRVAIGWRTGSRESFPQLRKAAASFEPTAHLGPGLDAWTVEANKAPEDANEWFRGMLLHTPEGPTRIFGTEDEAREFVRAGCETEEEAQPDYVGRCGFWYFAARYGVKCLREEVEHRENWSMGGGNFLKHGGKDCSGWKVRSVSLEGLGREVIEDQLPKPDAQPKGETEGDGYTVQDATNKRGPFSLVVLAERVERAEFERLRDSAEAAGGWYSRKFGKQPGGFGFDDAETAGRWAREEFGGSEADAVRDGEASAEALGLNEDGSEPCDECAQHYVDAGECDKGRPVGSPRYGDENNPTTEDGTRPDPRGPRPLEDRPAPVEEDEPYTPAKPDPKRAAAEREAEAERLEGLADSYQKDIDHKRAPLSQNWTARRARIKDGQKQDADGLELAQRGLRAMAQALRENALPADLAGLRTKSGTEAVLSNYNRTPLQERQRVALRALMERCETHEQVEADAERRAQDESQEARDRLRLAKVPGFFPSPPGVVAAVVEALGLEDGPHDFLEPSAGLGDLAQPLRDHVDAHGGSLTLCEHRQDLCKHLETRGFGGYQVIHADFLEHDLGGSGYDRIAMNPPFEKKQDEAHVRHALQFLAPGGRLVSVMTHRGAEAMHRVLRRELRIHTWVEELPEGSFKGADSFRSTGVSCCLLVAERD